jgi:hypothetical protein
MSSLLIGQSVRDLRTGKVGILQGWTWQSGYKRAVVLSDGKRLLPLVGEVVRVMKPLGIVGDLAGRGR